jgi:hypothetical protein
LAIFVHVGVVPDQEFLSSYRAFYEDPRFEKSAKVLVDLRRTDSSVRSSEALRSLAEFMGRQPAVSAARPRVAVIASEDLSFGLARMYQVFSDTVSWDFAVFRAPDAALAWLRVPQSLMEDLE